MNRLNSPYFTATYGKDRKKAEALERDSALYTGGDVIRELVD